MKRIFTLASLVLTFSASGFAQGEMDAFNLSYNDLTGTARGVAMGGAFGALGGDATGVAINPAGIGIYSSYEIVTTMNFTNTKTESNLLGSKMDDSKFKFNFDNISVVGIVPLNSDEVPLLNFGFAYNKLKSFNRKVALNGNSLANSMTHFMADRGNNSDYTDIISGNAYNTTASWLGILGYQSGLITPNANNNGFFPAAEPNEKINNSLYMHEKGDISSYDFNMGTTISDIISIGASVSVTDINYSLYSDYNEVLTNDGADFFLTNYLKTEGTGWQLKAGMIFKPIHELRIGVAYHSPTWYNMTDYYDANVDASWNSEIYYVPEYSATDYRLRTPDKWVFSLAGVIGQHAIISADYELTGYGRMQLKNDYGEAEAYSYENEYIKDDFRGVSGTLRLGAEVRFTPQFSGRVGYVWQQSPVKDILRNGSEGGENANHTVAIPFDKTVPHHSIVGDANHFTWGLGYRFNPIAGTRSHFYTDAAFVIKTRTDDFYAFPTSDKAELKTNQFTGLLSVGYKF